MFFIFSHFRLKYDLLFVDYHQYSSIVGLKLFDLFEYSIVFKFWCNLLNFFFLKINFKRYAFVCVYIYYIIHIPPHFIGYYPLFIDFFRYSLFFSVLFYLWEHCSFKEPWKYFYKLGVICGNK